MQCIYTYNAAAGVNLYTANIGEIGRLTDSGQVEVVGASTQEPLGVIIDSENVAAGRTSVLCCGIDKVRIGATFTLGTTTNMGMAAADGRVDPYADVADVAASSNNWCCGFLLGWDNVDYADGDTKPFFFMKYPRVDTQT